MNKYMTEEEIKNYYFSSREEFLRKRREMNKEFETLSGVARTAEEIAESEKLLDILEKQRHSGFARKVALGEPLTEEDKKEMEQTLINYCERFKTKGDI